MKLLLPVRNLALQVHAQRDKHAPHLRTRQVTIKEALCLAAGALSAQHGDNIPKAPSTAEKGDILMVLHTWLDAQQDVHKPHLHHRSTEDPNPYILASRE